jgi:hypothetical protein
MSMCIEPFQKYSFGLEVNKLHNLRFYVAMITHTHFYNQNLSSFNADQDDDYMDPPLL